MSIDAWITNLGKYNEGDLAAELVQFPTTAEDLAKALQNIGIDNQRYEEYFISDYDLEISDLHKYLGEYPNLDELNYLAEKPEGMQDYELEQFESLTELEGASNISDLINLTENLDTVSFIPDCQNEYDLGYYWVEDAGVYDTVQMGALARYIDYESFGRDIALDEQGAFINDGYAYITDSVESVYQGRDDIPEDSHICRDAMKLVNEKQAKESISATTSLRDKLQTGKEIAAKQEAPAKNISEKAVEL